ncbi:MAG: metallophosphoesterase [Hyphomicrobium sp.]|jgi:3',5'-cyclic AMP phosphodiesterase CpdA
MTETFTLAHLSDLHLGPIEGFHPRYWNAKRGLGYLNWHRGRRGHHLRSVADAIATDAVAQKPDHFAVTGDLVNLGLPSEYDVALAWLAGLGTAETVSVVPGNHDIYTGRLHGASCLTRWAPYMTTRVAGAPNDGEATFPFVREVGPIALIGLNSAVPTPVFIASGRLGAAQIAALAEHLDRLGSRGLVRVVLIHHPPLPGQAPPRRRLEDAAELQDVLDRFGAELVLHGHNHIETLAWRRRTLGSVPVIGVASGSAGRAHSHEPLARYNLLRVTRSAGRLSITCTVRGLAAAGGEIVELSRRELQHEAIAS